MMQTFNSSHEHEARGLEMLISQNLRSHRESGVTLVELLVVIVIIAIVAALALKQRGKTDAQLKRQNIAREFKVALERARFDSVKRRAQESPTDGRARVTINSGSYVLATYVVDSAGTATASAQTSDASVQNVVISGNNSITLPYTIYYNQRGEAVDASGNSISPSFYVCQVTCSSPTNANANLLIVTPTGTVNLLPGSSTVPSFSPPGVTAVSGGTAIRSETFVTPTP
jgi:prepilin-type N-terminal cleavage/methylation domain-containing protein